MIHIFFVECDKFCNYKYFLKNFSDRNARKSIKNQLNMLSLLQNIFIVSFQIKIYLNYKRYIKDTTILIWCSLQFIYKPLVMSSFFLLFVMLVVYSHTLTTYKSRFSTNVRQSGGIYQPTASRQATPTYTLGYLERGSTLVFQLQIPNFDEGGIPLEDHLIQLRYSDGNSMVWQPDFDISLCTSAQRSYENYCYFLFVIKQSASHTFTISGFDYVVQYFNLKITHINLLLGLTPLISLIETTRDKVAKLIYIHTRKHIQVSLFPMLASQKANKNMELYKITTNINQKPNIWTVDSSKNYLPNDVSQISFDSNLKIAVYDTSNTGSNYLDVGYYWLLVIFEPTVHPQGYVQFTWQTDNFFCPFYNTERDYWNNFEGCKYPTAYPCKQYIRQYQMCLSCIDGYVLQYGSCIISTECPERHYYKFGSCIEVNPLCGQFDYFTGQCLNCQDPLNYDCVNSACIPKIKLKAIFCSQRQWKKDSECYDVSETCGNFNPNDGKCVDCASKLFQLDSKGNCIAIVVTCSQRQYVDGLDCVNIPAECSDFDSSLKLCLRCIRGYTTDNTGKCNRIICPIGQVASPVDNVCKEVSPLCATYSDITGDCLSCKDSTHSLVDGKCRQVTSPLAGCLQRQRLGYGKCMNSDINCKIYNLKRMQCVQCSSNYYINYQGICVSETKCSNNQISVNGHCFNLPDNCLTADKHTAFCTKCINDDYQLIQGQCVQIKKCPIGYYSDDLGSCILVSPDCDLFNPRDGSCITCKNKNVNPSQGICCPQGQVANNNKICVNYQMVAKNLRDSSGSSCLTLHPVTGYCIRCSPGYIPSRTAPNQCIPK